MCVCGGGIDVIDIGRREGQKKRLFKCTCIDVHPLSTTGKTGSSDASN